MTKINTHISNFLAILAIGLSMVTSMHAQTDVKFVNEFLNIGVGARSHGMFGTVTATVDDVTAAYWNPAGLSGIERAAEVSAMHASWFGGIANYDYIAYAKRFTKYNNGYGSISLIRMGIDNIPNTLNLIGPDGSVNYDNILEFSAADYALFLSYGQDIRGTDFSFGLSSKLIFRTIGSFGQARGFGFDFGLQYHKGPLRLGIMGRDITTTLNNWSFTLSQEEQLVFEKTGNEIPVSSTELALPKLIFGASWMFGNEDRVSALIAADLRFTSDGTEAGVFSGDRISIDPSFGLELGYEKLVFLRLGIGNIQRTLNESSATQRSLEFQPNIGIGLAMGRVKIDYALSNIGNLSGVLASHIFSLSVQLYD